MEVARVIWPVKIRLHRHLRRADRVHDASDLHISQWTRVVTGSLITFRRDTDDARHEHARDEQLMTIHTGTHKVTLVCYFIAWVSLTTVLFPPADVTWPNGA